MSNTESKEAKSVWLVGAGPGEAGLLTLAGREALQHADVIFCDRLARPVLGALELPDSTEVVDVGKHAGQSHNQEGITQQLIEAAQAGRRVVRLKGGDPLIFARGGEEIEALRAAGIAVEVVPGISAVQAAAKALGVPLTHREAASALHMMTGHDLEHPQLEGERWLQEAAALRSGTTLVLYMGRRNLPKICDRLLGAGCPSWMPAAVVSHAGWVATSAEGPSCEGKGETAGEKIVRARLANLVERAELAKAPAPCIVIIGKVLLHDEWYCIPWENAKATAPDSKIAAPPAMLSIGSEAGIFYGSDEERAATELRAQRLLISRLAPNDKIFGPKLRGQLQRGEIDAMLVRAPADLAAIKLSLQRANLCAADIASVPLLTDDLRVERLAPSLLGLRTQLVQSREMPPAGMVAIHSTARPDPLLFPAEVPQVNEHAWQYLAHQIQAGDADGSCLEALMVSEQQVAASLLPLIHSIEPAKRPRLLCRNASVQRLFEGAQLETEMAVKLNVLTEAGGCQSADS